MSETSTVPAWLECRQECDRLRAELAEANNRWHSACDVGRRLEVRNAQLQGELAEARAFCEKLRRKLELALASLRAAMSDAASTVVQLQEQLGELAKRGEAT